MYLNNLAAILLRNNKARQAAALLEDYRERYDSTRNWHQKIGYASYQVRVLGELGQTALAELKARNFLKIHKADLLKHRWHHFFTSYINVLIAREKYAEVLKLSRKFGLKEKEKERMKKSNYVPNISWSISLSRYMEGKISDARLLDEIKEPLQDIRPTENQKRLIMQVINRFSENLPETFLKLKSYL